MKPDIVYNAIPTPVCPVVYKFFSVHHEGALRGRKTPIYSIVNNTSGDTLGEIRWYAPWRKFCFFPEYGTVWSDGCLRDVNEVIQNLMRDRTHAK